MLQEKIKILCSKKGVSIARMEREAGLGNGVISKWETSEPNLKTLQKIADYFKISLDELLK